MQAIRVGVCSLNDDYWQVSQTAGCLLLCTSSQEMPLILRGVQAKAKKLESKGVGIWGCFTLQSALFLLPNVLEHQESLI